MTQPNPSAAVASQPAQRYAPIGDSGLAFADGGQLWQIAGWIAKAGSCPAELRGKQADVFMLMCMGLEYRFGAIAALSLIFMVKGRPSLGYEACLAKMQSHPDMEYLRIRNEGTGEERCAVIQTKRRGRAEDNEPIRFSVADARQAGLYDEKWVDRNGEPSVWVKYTDDMLVAKAVARSKRRDWPDILPGLQVREDLEEPRVERNVTPRRAAPEGPDPAMALLGGGPVAVELPVRDFRDVIPVLRGEPASGDTQIPIAGAQESAAGAPDQDPGAGDTHPPRGLTLAEREAYQQLADSAVESQQRMLKMIENNSFAGPLRLTLADLDAAIEKRAGEYMGNGPVAYKRRLRREVYEVLYPDLVEGDERIAAAIEDVPRIEV